MEKKDPTLVEMTTTMMMMMMMYIKLKHITTDCIIEQLYKRMSRSSHYMASSVPPPHTLLYCCM
jgi:hypothetical protein